MAEPSELLVTEVEEQLDDTIRCRRCEHGITAGRFAIEVDGDHEHTFRNPAGWSFRLGCFADAPGAAVSGQATYAHTWFAGYAWRFAIARPAAPTSAGGSSAVPTPSPAWSCPG